MFAPLFLIVIVGLVWAFAAPGQQFLPGFARLLTEPKLQRGPFNYFSGRSYLTGRFLGREVAIRLQLKRTEHGYGYLVIAVRTGGPPTLDYNGIEAHTQDEAGRRALFTMAKHDLLLSVEHGWLKTMWKPQWIFFPNRFSEEMWRPVLEAMETIATSLDAAPQSITPPESAGEP